MNTDSQPPRLSGLQRLCKLYGRMKCGDVMMAWDYANECAVPESEMKLGGERWRASEMAKFASHVRRS